MSNTYSITIRFNDDGELQLETSDVAKISILQLIKALATASAALIETLAETGAQSEAARLLFLDYFAGDPEIESSNIIYGKKGENE